MVPDTAARSLQLSDLTPQQLDQLTRRQYYSALEPVTSPMAVHLKEVHGLAARAWRVDGCQNDEITLWKCPDDHIFAIPWYCNCRFCPKCAPRLRDSKLRWLEPWIRAIERTDNKLWPRELAEIAIHVPVNLERETVRRINHDVGQVMRDLAYRTAGLSEKQAHGVVFRQTPGADASGLCLRVIYWAKYWTPEQIRSAIREVVPEAVVSVRHRNSQRHIRQALRNMLEPMLPDTPEGRANMEALFAGVQTFQAFGSSLGEPDHEGYILEDVTAAINCAEEFIEGSDPTINSCSGCGHVHHPRCTRCGKYGVKRAARRPRGAPIDASDWFDVTPPAEDSDHGPPG